MGKIRFNYLVRNIDAGDYLENFLISAVASILAIRVILSLTNYPQLGGGAFHISHVLLGGFLMVVSIICLLTFLDREIKDIAATLGGIGFGTFIDELGKFITSDNDYLFQPTIAIIYVIFILIYLVYKLLDRPAEMTKKECAVNALEIIKEAVMHDFDPEEKRKAEEFLAKSDSADPVIMALKATLAQVGTIPLKKRGLVSKLKEKMGKYYIRFIRSRSFASIIITFFTVASILNILFSAVRIMPGQSFASWGILFSSSASGVFVIFGVYFIARGKRLPTYEMFKIAVLISIFLTQFFIFFEAKLSAVVILAVSIAIWIVLQALIRQEKLIKNNCLPENHDEYKH